MVWLPVSPAGKDTTKVHCNWVAGKPENAHSRICSPAAGESRVDAPEGSVWLTKAHPLGSATVKPTEFGVSPVG
jgi:hypothetical protein